MSTPEICSECEHELGECECSCCCDHSDKDEYCCLICGKDLAEDMLTAAFDRAKDARKYGE